MSVDPTAFASADEQKKIQQQLMGEYADRVFAQPAVPTPEYRRYLEIQNFSNQVMDRPNPYLLKVEETHKFINDLNSEDEVNQNALVRASAGYQLAHAANSPLAPPTPEETQTATGAVARAGMGALNTVLQWMDTPRRLMFENVVIPAARRIGLGQIAQDTPVDPNGRDLFLKATGGSVDKWVTDRIRSVGASEGFSQAAGSGISHAIGFGLDVLFDPLSWVTFGATGLEKAGGRVLTKEGANLAATLLDRSSVSTASTLIPSAANALGSVADTASPIGKLFAKGAALTAAGKVEDAAKVVEEANRLQGIQRRMLSGATAAADRLTMPEIDQTFAYLRGTGVQADLFKPGGMQFHLPFNAATLHVPFLNKEEQIGAFLGGRAVLPDAAQKLSELRTTAFDLGEAALAKVPIPDKVAALFTGVQRGVRWMFTPYDMVQGWGADFARELFKRVGNISRVESNKAAVIMRDYTKELTEADRQKLFYLTNNGAQVFDVATGTYKQEAISDYVNRLNYYTMSVRAEAGLPGLKPSQYTTIEDVNDVIKAHRDKAQQTLDIIGNMTPAQTATLNQVRIQPYDVSPFRDPNLIPAGTDFSIQDLLNKEIDNANTWLKNGQIPYRMSTRALVRQTEKAVAERAAGNPAALPRTTLEQLIPDDNMRNLVMEIYQREVDAFGHVGAQGPMALNLQMALDAGQQTLLLNHIGHIYNLKAPGASSNLRLATQQLGERIPGEIGQQRVLTAFSEPEFMEALGYSTNVEAIIAKKMAQYKTMSREGEFVRLMLDNFGKPKLANTPFDPSTETVFNPHEWFSKSLPDADKLRSQLEHLRYTENISDDEVATMLALQSGKMGRSDAYVIPKWLDEALKLNRNIAYNAAGHLAWMDGLLSIQRNLVTSIWPAYHARNIMGNAILSHMGGVPVSDYKSMMDAVSLMRNTDDPELLTRLTDVLRGADPNAHVGDSYAKLDLTTHNVRDWFMQMLEERGVIHGGHAAVDLSARAPNQNIATEAINKVAGNKAFEIGRNFGEATDNAMRVRYVWSRMQQGDSLEEAILGAKKYLFDFQDLSEFEKNVLRRTTFFYTFLRKNLPLQLEMLVHEPRGAAYWNAFYREMQDPEAKKRADAALLPAWIREQLGMVFGQNDKGDLALISGLGLPIEDINQVLLSADLGQWTQRFLGLTNPWIQGALASAGMPLSFTQRPVVDDNFQNYYRQLSPTWGELVAKAPGLAQAIDLQSREVVDPNGNVQTLYSANPKILYGLYSALSLGRTIQTIGKGVEAVRSGDENKIKPWLAQTLLGFKTSKVDISQPVNAVHTGLETQKIDQETSAAVEHLDQQFYDGQIEADAWRSRRSDALAKRANQRDLLAQQQMKQEGVTVSPVELAAIQKHRGAFVDMGIRLLNLYYDLDPTGNNPLTGEPFRNAREWAELRDDIMHTVERDYPDAAQRAKTLEEQRRKKMSPVAQQVEADYAQAKQLLSEYEMVPKYLGLTSDEMAKADAAIQLARTYTRDMGPAQGRMRLFQENPEAYQLMRRALARPNTRARQAKWRELEAESNGLLSKFFGNLPYQESVTT